MSFDTALYTCVTTVALVTSFPLTSAISSSLPQCGENEYYDSGTASCEPCYDICMYAAHYKTVDECKTNCPDYNAGKDCKEDEYFDDVVHSCTSCGEICDYHKFTHSTNQCYEKCRAYMEKKEPQVVSHTGSDTLKAAESQGNSNGGSSAGFRDASSFTLSNPGWVAATALGALCVILIIVIIIQLVRNRNSYNPVNKEDVEPGTEPANPRATQPVEESNSSGSHHFAFSGCQALGFSDLSQERE